MVFARSVLPISSLSGSLAHLRRLQNRPLGAILFKNAGMRRSPFEVARLEGDCDYIPDALRQPGKGVKEGCFAGVGIADEGKGGNVRPGGSGVRHLCASAI